ncbi:MAG: PASTA domain-containing protein [Bacteroidales bacterium]
MLKKILSYIRTHNILRHALYITATFLVVIIIASIGMNVYTQHGEAIRVPQLKGLRLPEAIALLERESLNYEVVDSLYDTTQKPGIIIEMTPHSGSSVKRNRTIYLVINSVVPQKLSIPYLTDLSSRQAQSLLEGLGFPSPEIVYVSSRYKDLVVGANYKGRSVRVGEKFPVTSKLQLLVGNGIEEELTDSVDSLADQVDPELFVEE